MSDVPPPLGYEELGPFTDPALLRHLVDDGIVVFVVLDSLGTITWIGRSSAALLGAEPQELVGTSVAEVVDPEDLDAVIETLAEPVRNAEERILAVIRVRHADGSWITLEFGGIDLRDAEGHGHFLAWGRPYESAGLLLDYIDSLLDGDGGSVAYDQVVRFLDGLAPYSASAVHERGEDGRYRCVGRDPGLPTALAAGLELPTGPGDPWERSLALARPLQATLAELPEPLAREAEEHGLHGVWITPVVGEDPASPDGWLTTWRRRSGLLLATHARHLEQTARLTRVAMRWARSHRNLVVAATTDPLTGAANRTQLQARVAEADHGCSALLFCDLDDFKRLNDTHGHGIGDQALRLVADRFRSVLRDQDLLARLGGDEFAVWCPTVADPEEVDLLAERLLGCLAEPLVVDGLELRMTCSIGVALVDRPGGEEGRIDDILHRADRGLYAAKAEGKNRARTVGGG